MPFAYIGCKTDYYVSLHNHFTEKNSLLHIYTTIDTLLNETFADGYSFNALIIDYDSHTSSYNFKITQCLKMLHPNALIFFLISDNAPISQTLLSIENVACLDKSLPIEDITIRIHTSALKKHSTPKEHLQIGRSYTFDIQSSVLRYRNAVQPLTKKEIAFLRLLIERGDIFTSLEEISHLMYPHSSDDKQLAIRSLVLRLRRKLHEDIIETYLRYGYRLKPFSESI